MQRRRRLQLRPQIGRGIEKNPSLAVGADGKTCLSSRFHPPITGPSEATDRAAAIPLWKASTGRSTEDDGGQAPHSGNAKRNRRSEFGRQIAVDLEADADFDEGRGCPGHGCVPLCRRETIVVRSLCRVSRRGRMALQNKAIAGPLHKRGGGASAHLMLAASRRRPRRGQAVGRARRRRRRVAPDVPMPASGTTLSGTIGRSTQRNVL